MNKESFPGVFRPKKKNLIFFYRLTLFLWHFLIEGKKKTKKNGFFIVKNFFFVFEKKNIYIYIPRIVRYSYLQQDSEEFF